MIVATSHPEAYVTAVTDGPHTYLTDTAASNGGTGDYQRPGSLFASTLAACMNINARKQLEARGIAYDSVRVLLDMNAADLDHLTFRTKIEVTPPLSPAQQQELESTVSSYPIYRMMCAEKNFLPWDAAE